MRRSGKRGGGTATGGAGGGGPGGVSWPQGVGIRSSMKIKQELCCISFP